MGTRSITPGTTSHRKDAYFKARRIDPNRFTANQIVDKPFAVIARIVERLAAAEQQWK
jgi:hypothetical protein